MHKFSLTIIVVSIFALIGLVWLQSVVINMYYWSSFRLEKTYHAISIATKNLQVSSFHLQKKDTMKRMVNYTKNTILIQSAKHQYRVIVK